MDTKINSIKKDLFFTVLTLGFYNIYVQIRQILDVNDLIGENKFSFTKMIMLSIFTLGLYFCWHQYSLTLVLQKKLYDDEDWFKPLWTIPLCILGPWIIVDCYQQYMINKLIQIKLQNQKEEIVLIAA